MKKKNVVIMGLVLLLIGFSVVLSSKNNNNSIYIHFNVNQMDLRWGMHEEEVIYYIGEPDSVSKTDSGNTVIMHYSNPVETDIGISKGADIYIDTSEFKNINNESYTVGFFQIDLFFDEISEKNITAKIEKKYGSIDGGKTYLDDVLGEIDSDMFSTTYYLKAGMINELPLQTQDEMLKVLEINNLERSKKFIGSLVTFNLIGNKEKVKVSINAKNLLIRNISQKK